MSIRETEHDGSGKGELPFIDPASKLCVLDRWLELCLAWEEEQNHYKTVVGCRSQELQKKWCKRLGQEPACRNWL